MVARSLENSIEPFYVHFVLLRPLISLYGTAITSASKGTESKSVD